MELIINNNELNNQFQIKMFDLYINNRIVTLSQNYCKIKTINDTHSRFKIPYTKCSTLETVSNFCYFVSFFSNMYTRIFYVSYISNTILVSRNQYKYEFKFEN